MEEQAVATLAPTKRTRLKRVHERGHFDKATVYAVLDAGMICHVGYVIDGAPYVTPTIHWREGDMVYLGVDGLWWREFQDDARPVTLLLRGQTLSGQAVAIVDDPARTQAVFARLRPTAPTWLPGRMRGVLVQVTLNEE